MLTTLQEIVSRFVHHQHMVQTLQLHQGVKTNVQADLLPKISSEFVFWIADLDSMVTLLLENVILIPGIVPQGIMVTQ